MNLPIARSYTGKSVWHRPRSVFIARQATVVSAADLYLDELPP
jgi:hypothetical protein